VRRAATAAIAVAVTLCAAGAAARTAGAAAADQLRLADARPIPIEYFQGLTHSRAGARFFDGVVAGLYRTDAALRERARVLDALPPAVRAAFGFNHIGDLTWDAAEGGRLILPLECFTPGAPNGGNTCGQGGFGVADPVTLALRYVVPLDPRDIAKAMWAEVSPDGRLVWTSSGPDLLAYRAEEISAAGAAAGVRIRPAVRRRAVPPSGITGAAFLGDRMLLAGQATGPLEIWSVDVRTGARRREARLDANGESEGLDVVDDGHGLVHWIVTPFDPRGRRPTYGTGHNELLSFVPAADARLRMTVAPARLRAGRSTTLSARVTLRVGGRVHTVSGARVRAAGRTATTDARGVARLRVRRARPGVVRVRATKQRLRPATVPLAVG
jgi:hypothetical protein